MYNKLKNLTCVTAALAGLLFVGLSTTANAQSNQTLGAQNQTQFSPNTIVSQPSEDDIIVPAGVNRMAYIHNLYNSPQAMSAAPQVAPNPNIPSSVLCQDFRVIFVLDESGSIDNTESQLVRQGVRSLALALLNSGADLHMIEFSTTASVINLGGSLVTPAFMTNLDLYLGTNNDVAGNSGFNGQRYRTFAEGCDGRTNWEAGLIAAQGISADLVIFFTDGNPTAYNVANGNCAGGTVAIPQVTGVPAFPGFSNATALNNAIVQANAVKAQGKHMFVAAVGNDLNLSNCQKISGNDNFAVSNNVFTGDYVVGEFETLAFQLEAAANNVCGTELAISKTVDVPSTCVGSQVTFTISVTNTGGDFGFTAINTRIQDVVPSGFSNPQIVNPAPAGASFTGNTLNYNVGDLANGATRTISFTATVMVPPATFNNVATADANNANLVSDDAPFTADYAVTTVTETACDSYTWFGTTYTQSGSYERIFNNANGCPQKEILNLTIGENTTATVAATACDTYTWALNGQTYTTSGAYAYESENAAGCTLTTTLNLTINNSGAETITATILAGESYSFFGQSITTAGTYTNNGVGANGCPFVTTLILTVEEDNNNGGPIACGENQIENGNFEAGNVDFTSDFTYKVNNPAVNTEMIPENTYSVGENANAYHPQWSGVGRSGKFLILNGNTVTEKTVWAQDVVVSNGREYVFNLFAQNIFATAPSSMKFVLTPNDFISPAVVFGTYTATTGLNGWSEVSAVLNSTYTGSAKLSIVSDNITAFGNDFGIDDISFIETCPVSCSPIEVISFNQGPASDLLSPVAAERSNANEALGAPENSDAVTTPANNNFVSLGFGGEIVLKFGYPIKNGAGDDIFVVETTFNSATSNNCSRYPERIRAYASQDNCNWVYLGEGCQDTYFDLQGLNWAQYVKIVDISNNNSFNGLVDAYDLDGIICLHGEETNPTATELVFGSAQDVVIYEPGFRKNGSAIVANRRVATNALGVPQNTNTVNFVSLGFGGKLEVKFDYVVFDAAGADIQLVETSYGNPSCASYPEKAQVEGSLDGNTWIMLNSEICLDGLIDVAAAGAIQYLRVTDRTLASTMGGTADGYDVDGFVVLNACASSPARLGQIGDDVQTADEVVSTSAYPNPFENELQVSIATGDQDKVVTLTVMNNLGQIVMAKRVNVTPSSETIETLNLESLRRGIYLLNVETQNTVETIKIVKQ
jgi:uncharacterized repeat protein (TIGR01451 family)